MNPRNVGIITLTALLVLGSVLGYGLGSRMTTAPAAPAPIAVPRPISDVVCGVPYEMDHLERFMVGGRVAVNFTFGGKDRNLQPQYIWDENVIGQSTEIRSVRRVDRSLEYSRVTFMCLDDPTLEGHKISNMKVMRYQLTLRRPLRQQRVIRNGGSVRNP